MMLLKRINAINIYIFGINKLIWCGHHKSFFYIIELLFNVIFLFQKIWKISIITSLLRHMYHVQIITTYFKKKKQTILISAKYNHKSTKEINLLSSRRLSKMSLNDTFQNFLVKKKKNRWFWLKLLQTYSSTISFAYF